MKKIILALFTFGMFFTACKKETLTSSQPVDVVMNTVKISGREVTFKLISVKGVTDNMDYCFKLFLDEKFQEDFRFTGGYNLWNYKNLSNGTHTLGITCLHECKDQNENKILQFEIEDSETKQLVTAIKRDHCSYQIGMLVAGK